ncbi:MAG: 50S ribosomal protein L10 [Candidatus Pacebacteria bacterium]|nr:50S ribosomal protein L10 [Candidatus Paceibacterota bacterium]
MITKGKKKEILQDISERFAKSKSMVFLGFQGVTVKDSMELRRTLKKEGVDYKVVKKTLIKKGLESVNVKGSENFFLEGPVGVAIGNEDEIAPARIAKEFGKKNDKLKILGGVMDFQFIGAEEMKQIASLPSKDQLRGQLVGTINAPVSGFVNVLAGNVRSLLNVLMSISEEKK